VLLVFYSFERQSRKLGCFAATSNCCDSLLGGYNIRMEFFMKTEIFDS